eukprot:TRINITY_DN75861_c0_g1_i1.p1 TRINITY_DN75861_c0_g1~~TRINITY_DN75861_c0_g1_i1.p1  ORF type:complete len:308 (+),score=30.81 TRINITY_DN75861_c0_g1_i1:24-926(+)
MAPASRMSRSRSPSESTTFRERLTKDIHLYASEHGLDDRVTNILLNMHPLDVRKVMARPFPRECRSPAGFVISVIRKVEAEADRPLGYRWDGSFDEAFFIASREWRCGRRARSCSTASRSPFRGSRAYKRSISRYRARRSTSSDRSSKSSRRRSVSSRRSISRSRSSRRSPTQPSNGEVCMDFDESCQLSSSERESVVKFFDGASIIDLLLEGTSVMKVPDFFMPALLNGFPYGFPGLSQEGGMKLLDVLSDFTGGSSAKEVERSAEVRHEFGVSISGQRLVRKSMFINGTLCTSEARPI